MQQLTICSFSSSMLRTRLRPHLRVEIKELFNVTWYTCRPLAVTAQLLVLYRPPTSTVTGYVLLLAIRQTTDRGRVFVIDFQILFFSYFSMAPEGAKCRATPCNICSVIACAQTTSLARALSLPLLLSFFRSYSLCYPLKQVGQATAEGEERERERASTHSKHA